MESQLVVSEQNYHLPYDIKVTNNYYPLSVDFIVMLLSTQSHPGHDGNHITLPVVCDNW